MKKIITVILSVVLCVVMFAGCTVFEHNYEVDYAREIISIAPITETFTGEKPVLDEQGLPLFDEFGNPITETVTQTYTSRKISVKKSHLVNYVNNYLQTYVQEQGMSVEAAVEYLAEMLKSAELVMVEVEKLFDAEILYWTKDDVESIQQSVYKEINQGILQIKNSILSQRDKDLINLTEEELAAQGETTYPIMPTEEETHVSPRYYVEKPTEFEYEWYDSWYLNDRWYIEGEEIETSTGKIIVNPYENSFPGMYGDEDDKSLSREALQQYINQMFESSQNLINTTKEQEDIMEGERNAIKNTIDSEGVEYAYPMLGKTLMAKMLIGRSYINTIRLEKLEKYVTIDQVSVAENDVLGYYNSVLSTQTNNFRAKRTSSMTDAQYLAAQKKAQEAYDAAVQSKDLILFHPSNRYVFVKHILLPFSTEQTKALSNFKSREGYVDGGKNDEALEAKVAAFKAELAENTVVYPHVNGENDTNNPKTSEEVFLEIKAQMNRVSSSVVQAERLFNEYIYKYNTDPGIFDNDMGYAVVFELGQGEPEQFMTEFAEGARDFRREGYSVGRVLNNYVVTDYGIHIMYYLADYPAQGATKRVSDFTTPGQKVKIYDEIEKKVMEKKQQEAYSFWESKYMKDYTDKYVKVETKIIDSYIEELQKLYNMD
jgi:hypothetical protein